MIGDEQHLPYDRPPLSKQVLAGAWERARTALRDPDTYGWLALDMRLGAPATGLDITERTVTLHNGDQLGYDALVIATGVTPRRLPSGHELGGVHVLRTVDDAVALRTQLLRSSSVAVVGAGFLGCEVAATTRRLGLNTTLIDPCQCR